MRKTKILALLLVVALIASMVVPGVSAAEDYAIEVTDASGSSAITANAGEEILVKLNVVGNPGISGLALYLTYPEAWENTFVINKKLFNDAAETTHTASPNLSVNPYFVNWIMPYGTTATPADRTGKKLSTDNGALLDVYILIPANTPSGTYEIGVTTAGLEGSNFAEQVDANGVIIPGGQTSLVIPDTSSKLTVTVNGVEPEVPAGAACPEHTDVTTWTEIAEGTWTGGAIADGHYKLTGNQTLASALTVAGNVCIDLNGFNITAPKTNNIRAIEIAAGANLVIADSAEVDGVISGGQVYNSTGSTVTQKFGGNIYNEGTFTLYGGTISGGYAYTNSTYYPHISGGNIYGAAGSVINIKGGTVTEGKVYKPSSYTSNVGIGGGNIFSEGTLNISGGVISNGVVEKKGAVDHYNVRNNYIYGGNIRMRGGELNISGDALITGGKLTGVAVNGGSSYNGGPMTAYIRGGNIYAEKTTVNISGGTVADGLIDMEVKGNKNTGSKNIYGYFQGGNICIYNGTATISGGLITGGQLKGKVSLYKADGEGTLNLETYGGNLAILGGAQVEMTAGLITKGVSSKMEGASGSTYGGNVTVSGENSTFVMTGGELSEGYATYRGGNLSGHSKAAITVGGTAVIKNGVADPATSGYRGSEIVVTTAGTVVTINEGAQILNDNAVSGETYLSTVYAITNASIVVNGGKVQGELCTAGTDSNKDGTLTVNGGDLDVITQSSVITNVTIGSGVTFKSASWRYITSEAIVLDAETGKYTSYATLNAALAAAAAGDKVVMLADATAASVAVPAGVTLNLNGKTLTAEAFTSFIEGAQTIDSVGTGKLVSSSASFAADNAQLPVEVNGEFTFEAVQFASKYEEVGTKATYKFYIAAEAAATLIDDAILAGDDVALQVKVTWTDANGDAQDKTFVLNTADLALYAGNWDTKMIILTITDISAVTNVNCVAQVVANGVTVGA